jgi:hypothetical protein
MAFGLLRRSVGQAPETISNTSDTGVRVLQRSVGQRPRLLGTYVGMNKDVHVRDSWPHHNVPVTPGFIFETRLIAGNSKRGTGQVGRT